MSEGTKNVLTALFVIALLVGVFGSLAWLSSAAHKENDRRSEFEGACKVLEGTVHDDLCVKDDKVVLTMKEFDK